MAPSLNGQDADDRTAPPNARPPSPTRIMPADADAATAESNQVHPGQRGTSRWSRGRLARRGQIEGYTTRVSGLSGEPVNLRISTTAATYRVVPYRFGDYQGGPAHRVWSSHWLDGVRQARPIIAISRTRTVIAPWRTRWSYAPMA